MVSRGCTTKNDEVQALHVQIAQLQAALHEAKSVQQAYEGMFKQYRDLVHTLDWRLAIAHAEKQQLSTRLRDVEADLAAASMLARRQPL